MTEKPGIITRKKSWDDKVVIADKALADLNIILQENGIDLPKTPRRPDIRLIVENTSGHELSFQNPGDHSSALESIPADGEKKAVMIMLQGDTLEEQFKNAKAVVEKYNLDTEGFTDAFLSDLIAGKTEEWVSEAYGPAPFAGQAEKLEPLNWENENGRHTNITPVQGKYAAFGARPAQEEMVFLTQYEIFVKGTGTTAELVESDGMCVAVSEDWKTGAISTRPIVPSIARGFYGAHYEEIPIVTMNPDGFISKVDLRTEQRQKSTPTAKPNNRFKV